MPNPEPTLAEICKTLREMEAKATAAPWTAEQNYSYWEMNGPGDFGQIGDTCASSASEPEYGRSMALGSYNAQLIAALRTHALALVQAAESNGELRDIVDSLAMRLEALRKSEHAAAEQGEKYRQAGEDICELIDSGFLVRDTSRDHEPGFGIRIMGLVSKLACAITAIRAVPASQALSSGAPPSIRVTLGGTTNPNEAARGGSST